LNVIGSATKNVYSAFYHSWGNTLLTSEGKRGNTSWLLGANMYFDNADTSTIRKYGRWHGGMGIELEANYLSDNGQFRIIGSPYSSSDGGSVVTPNYLFIVNNAGQVGIGTTDPSYQLELSTDSAGKPTSDTWTIVSDIRLKENIAPFEDGLDILKQLNPVSYELNGQAGMPAGAEGIGLIAQHVKDIIPYTIGTFTANLDGEETELYNFDGSALTYITINALKELSEVLEGLEMRIGEMGEIVGGTEGTEESDKLQLVTSEDNSMNAVTLEERVELLETTVFTETDKLQLVTSEDNSLKAVSLGEGEATPSAQLASLSLSELFSLVSENDVEGDIKLDQNLALYGDLNVLGKTVVSDLGVTGQMTIGLLVIDGLSGEGTEGTEGAEGTKTLCNSELQFAPGEERAVNCASTETGVSIATLSGPLRLQATALGNLEIMGGKVTIDTEGILTVEGTIRAQVVETGKIRIATAGEASEEERAVNCASTEECSKQSLLLADARNSELQFAPEDNSLKAVSLEEESADSIGTAFIPAGETAIVVETSALTEESLIFVTPERPVAIGSQKVESGRFEVRIGEELEEDLEVSWWVIN